MINENDIKYKNFITNYVNIISENYDEFEKKRLLLLCIVIFLVMLSVLILVRAIIVCFKEPMDSIIIFASAIIPMIFVVKIKKHYCKYIKNAILPKLLKKHFNISVAEAAPENIILSCGLFPHNSFILYNDDCFEGTYNDINFKISEIRIDIPDYKTSTTIFNGIIVVLNNFNQLPNNIILTSNSFDILENQNLFRILFIISVFVCLILHFLKLSFFELLLINFIGVAVLLFCVEFVSNKIKNSKERLQYKKSIKNYNIKALNMNDTKQLINSPFMDKLQNFKNFKNIWGRKCYSCAFYDEYIILTIKSNKDFFEIGELKTPLKNSKTIYKFYNEINSIFQLIDYFKLDNNTGN